MSSNVYIYRRLTLFCNAALKNDICVYMRIFLAFVCFLRLISFGHYLEMARRMFVVFVVVFLLEHEQGVFLSDLLLCSS